MLKLFLAIQLCVAVCTAEFQHKHGIRGSRGDHSLPIRQLQTYSVKFSLYNALTDTLVAELSQGAAVNIGSIPPGNLNFVADVTGTAPGSVKMSLTGAKSFQGIEGAAPYALCGNLGKDFLSCNGLTTGKYTIGAVLYSGTKAKGTILFSSNLDFELTAGSIPQPTPIVPVPVPTAPVPVPTAPVPVPSAPVPVPTAPVPVPTAPVPVPTAPVPVPTAPVPTTTAVPPTSCSVPKVITPFY
jgi:hypothetical protein